MFVAKFDSAGNHLWSQRMGDGYNQTARALAVDGTGNITVAGTFSGTLDLDTPLASSNEDDVFVVQLDPLGVHRWSRAFGNSFPGENVNGVAADAAGSVVVAGYYQQTVDFGGGPLSALATHDAYVVKFDLLGNHVWSKSFGGAELDGAHAIAVDTASNILVTGMFYDTVDFGGGPLISTGEDVFLLKLTAAGVHVWSKGFSGELPQDIAVDPAGSVVIIGTSDMGMDFGGGVLPSAGDNDVYAAKFDAAGLHVWSKAFASAGVQEGASVATDPSGNVILAGTLTGSVDFGGGALANPAAQNMFVAKLAP